MLKQLVRYLTLGLVDLRSELEKAEKQLKAELADARSKTLRAVHTAVVLAEQRRDLLEATFADVPNEVIAAIRRQGGFAALMKKIAQGAQEELTKANCSCAAPAATPTPAHQPAPAPAPQPAPMPVAAPPPAAPQPAPAPVDPPEPQPAAAPTPDPGPAPAPKDTPGTADGDAMTPVSVPQ